MKRTMRLKVNLPKEKREELLSLSHVVAERLIAKKRATGDVDDVAARTLFAAIVGARGDGDVAADSLRELWRELTPGEVRA